MPISNPEVKARDKTDGDIGYKKRRVSDSSAVPKLPLPI